MRYFISISILYWGFIASAQQSLLSPRQFLGYDLGDRFTPHHKVIDYFKYVAESVDNLKLVEYGETYEHRPLVVAIITSPENFGQLETIRLDNLRRAQLEEGNITTKKSIVWLSYNVHGNETSSTEASMATLYELANPGFNEKQNWLQNTVVIIDPCINPDGRDRYVNWFNQVRNKYPNPNIDGKEHHEPWRQGRTNHYLFDLNRDWAWQKQIESKQRIALYNQWLPHIHVDFHEQSIDEPYYFAPASEPLHELITPWQRQFQTTIGENHIKYFDKNNWLYFTKEKFDLFYPSYGDTYPSFNGAIGMTYEQAGLGKAGVAVLKEEGDTLTLKDRIDHHFTTGVSTVEITSRNSNKVVDEFESYFANALSDPKGRYKTFVIKGDNQVDKLIDLFQWLDDQQIRYGKSPVKKSTRAFRYSTNKTETVTINTNDWIISAYQPKSVLTQVLFEPQSNLSDSITYDITAWAIPYVYDLEAYALTDRINSSPTIIQEDFEPLEVEDPPYAYILPWTNLQDAKWLSRLLTQDVRMRHAEINFSIGGKNYGPGTLIVTRNDNQHLGDNFDQIVIEATNSLKRPVRTTNSGYVSQGKDFGSGDVHFIKAPNVAVLSGAQVKRGSFGEVWYFFDQEIEYPLTVLDTEYLEKIELSKYDVLILPDGSYELNEDLVQSLSSWVTGGGQLILIKGAVESFADKKDFQLKSFATEEEETTAKIKDKEEILSQRLDLYKDRERNFISDSNPGSIYKLRMDNSHPMAFGYPEHYFSLIQESNKYAYLAEGWNVGVVQNETDILSGFAGYKARQKMSKALIYGVEDLSEGHIIYMVNNPLFRAFWYNGKLLFANAIFMVGNG